MSLTTGSRGEELKQPSTQDMSVFCDNRYVEQAFLCIAIQVAVGGGLRQIKTFLDRLNKFFIQMSPFSLLSETNTKVKLQGRIE